MHFTSETSALAFSAFKVIAEATVWSRGEVSESKTWGFQGLKGCFKKGLYFGQ
jgi:hypothetical protein